MAIFRDANEEGTAWKPRRLVLSRGQGACQAMVWSLVWVARAGTLCRLRRDAPKGRHIFRKMAQTCRPRCKPIYKPSMNVSISFREYGLAENQWHYEGRRKVWTPHRQGGLRPGSVKHQGLG